MVINYRTGRHPGSLKCFDADTGEEVTHVFYYDDATHNLGRYAADAAGKIAFAEAAGRNGRTHWQPTEVWETRALRLEPVDDDVRRALGRMRAGLAPDRRVDGGVGGDNNKHLGGPHVGGA